MATFDPTKLKFSLWVRERSILSEYLELVANSTVFMQYKEVIQHGGKRGESLYMHVVNGVMLLDALRPALYLSDAETRLLFAVFTIHDINKDPQFAGRPYAKIAIPKNFDQQIRKLGLDTFFPEYAERLTEITQIAGQHSAHSGPVSVMAPSGTTISSRLSRLIDLIRAVDILGLSHTLEERTHKATFLSHFNALVADRQYTFYLHRLTENRGTLANIFHQAVVTVLQEQGLTPLLYYPDGVAYLLPAGQPFSVDSQLRRRMARGAAGMINELTGQGFESFIVSGIHGVKVDPKCLELGIPFDRLWTTMHTRVQTRNIDRPTLLGKVIDRTERGFEKHSARDSEAAAIVREKLDDPERLLPQSTDRLRDGELVRTYYIFLNTHISALPDAWEHIYDLFDLPAEEREWLSFFDARLDRPYAFINLIGHSHESTYETIEADGSRLLSEFETGDDKGELFEEYLERYALFGPPGRLGLPGTGRFGDHLRQYVTTQHKQCVHCSTTFPTDKWMTNDVRSDISVQSFSNRLRGGPGEPKKNICRICQLQFLVERLNFEEVRDEKTMYLHFFPYSFLPAPYLTAMRNEIDEIRRSDAAVRALWCDTNAALSGNGKGFDPDFATRTKKDKPHPYGIYMPRVPRNTVGNRLIFPINPPSDGNDSQRFLFALWNALVLQKHLGLQVMLTEAPVAPFTPASALYVDNVALSCRGLVGRNDYPEFADPTKPEGEKPLQELRRQAETLHRLTNALRTASKLDEMLALVQAMAGGPLSIYYAAEKLLEARARDQKASSPEWLQIRLSQQIFPDLQPLVFSKGGKHMAELSTHLQKLAEIAWQGGLRGKSLKKNSLMTPLDAVFVKLNQRSQAFDDVALKAAIAEDIFEYLERIADEQYAPGRRKMEAATAFVEAFFTDVYYGSYNRNLTRLLADEKMLRSAFMFYIRQQIPARQFQSDQSENE